MTVALAERTPVAPPASSPYTIEYAQLTPEAFAAAMDRYGVVLVPLAVSAPTASVNLPQRAALRFVRKLWRVRHSNGR